MAESPFLAACRGEPHDTMPVWFMRQAGRALPEYRAIRREHGFQDVVHTPDLAAEVTLQPVRRYGVDAAILFSDIVTPVQAIGLPVEIRKGIGPVLDDPIRTPADLDRLRPIDPEADAPYVLETVRILARELGDTPLIGFAGAPFTLASYLVEGRPSKNYAHTKALMYGDEATWYRADGRARRHRRGAPARPGRRRGPRGPAVRLVGRGAAAGRLRAPRAAVRRVGSSRALRTSACPASTSASAPASCSA